MADHKAHEHTCDTIVWWQDNGFAYHLIAGKTFALSCKKVSSTK
jgi:hypothetical protein